MASTTNLLNSTRSRYAVKDAPSAMAVRPIGVLLMREGIYRSGHPKTSKDMNACPTGIKIKYTIEYIVEDVATPSKCTIAKL
jgi:hypothetical protein